jgi:hypothetical protein
MLIREVTLLDYASKAWDDEVEDAIEDLLSSEVMTRMDAKEIPTEMFRDLLAKNGFLIDLDTLVKKVRDSGFASSADHEKIVPADELSGDVETDSEPSVDVGKMAGDQALGDIKA